MSGLAWADHHSVDWGEHDDEGFLVPTCSCGWKFGPVPDDETAVDCLMQHAYERGRVDRAREDPDA